MKPDLDNLIPLIPDKENMPKEIAAIPALPSTYNENDSRVVDILNKAAAFCGKEFTVIPPNPDGEDNPDYDPENPDDPTNPPKEGGDIMPLDDDIEVKPKPGDDDFVIDPEDPDKEGQIDPDVPGEPYPDGTGEDPNPDLDDLRDKYKEALAKNKEEKEAYWAVLWQVIRLLSTMSCWTESYDDTFIVQKRTQIFNAKQVNGCCKPCCNCDEDQIMIPLEYAPLGDCERGDKPFIRAIITVFVKGEKREVVVDQEYLNDRYDYTGQRLFINREDFPDILYVGNCGTCCLCERDLTITLFYNAGYCTIPEAILPLICQMMGKVEDSKLPLSNCKAAFEQVSGLLKSKKMGNIQYTWSDNDNKLANTQNLFAEIYNVAMLGELFGLSRCEIVNKVDAGDVI